MADGDDFLQLGQRGVGMFFDMGLELGGIKLAPGTPAGFGGQRVGFDRGQIAVNCAATQGKVLPRFDVRTARLNEFYHPFA